MNGQSNLKRIFDKFIEAIRVLKGKEVFRLSLYRGSISPEEIDIAEKNIIGQAMRSCPDRIHLVDEFELTMTNDTFSPAPIDSVTGGEILPLITTTREYINIFMKP